MNASREAAIALRREMMELLPRIGYMGDGEMPVLRTMDPVQHRKTGKLAFLLMDAENIDDATYVVAMHPDRGTSEQNVIGSATARYYAEWN